MDLSYVEVYYGAMVRGVPLLFVVVGLVEWAKSLGAQGNALRLSSMAVGIVLGLGFMVTQTEPPVDGWYPAYVYWFGNVVYGLGLGLVASGLYDTVKRLLTKQPPVG